MAMNGSKTESNELNSVPRNRGFYVKMKLLHTRHGRETEKKKTYCYRFLKWVLWVSFSFYFFTSYLITDNPQTPKSHSSSSVSNPVSRSRTLFESINDTASEQLRNHRGLFNDLKVFVYDLPSKYNTDWLSNERCRTHLFASEVAIHRAMSNSGFRTYDPSEADFFFVPVYVSCNFSAVNGFSAIGHARGLISSAIELISSELPYWNRSHGSDHVFVASHDFGACFHTMEDVAIRDGIPEFLKKSIVLQTFGVEYQHPCQEVENVVIPPYISPESIESTLADSPVNGRRDIFVFFRGKMEVHPKNISGRFYSKRVRTAIWQKYAGDRRFYLKRNRFAGYQTEIARSVFCLCPLGWAPWSPRLVESVVLGCVPVIIADGIKLPFPAAVSWPEISVTIAEKDVGKLGTILEHVAGTNLSAIQRNLADPTVRRALLFNKNVREGDATWQVLDALSNKLERSHRRSRAF